MKCLIYIVVLLGFTTSHAQEILLKGSGSPADKSETGPNEKNFYYQGFSYELNVTSPTSWGWKYDPYEPVYNMKLGSGDLTVFNGYKRKINSVLSAGWEAGWKHGFEFINSNSTNYIDTTLKLKNQHYKRELLSLNYLFLSPYVRFNFDPHRGDNLGIYFDIGIDGKLNIGDAYRTMFTREDKVNVKTRYSNLGFVNPFNSAIKLRFGVRKIAIISHYHLTSYLKSGIYDLPRLTAGIELQIR